ncbi:MAG: PEPxxWA-CTERM sorting domain-containing protein, partial [Sandaracinobacteroides sp.]
VSPPVSAVPEPASWALLIAGFGLVGGSLRSRRSKALQA